jgi:hypothetical protein
MVISGDLMGIYSPVSSNEAGEIPELFQAGSFLWVFLIEVDGSNFPSRNMRIPAISIDG